MGANEEIKPCPFCGGKPRIWMKVEDEYNVNGNVSTRSEKYRVKCNSCFCGTGWTFYEDFAIEKWNNRANDGSPNDGVDILGRE